MFNDCDGECCICSKGGYCAAGHGDFVYSTLADKEQIIDRLDNGKYHDYRQLMIETLKNVYNYEYK